VIGNNLEENRAFVSLVKNFKAAGLPVPELYAVSENGMAYIQQDLGDTTLYNKVNEAVKAGQADAVLSSAGRWAP
jgi:aminoglycoside/choline kinase family phosphotransferase